MNPLPGWLVDWIADTSDSVDEAIRVARAWQEAIEPTPTPFGMARYHELRARGVPPAPFDVAHRTGFWRQSRNGSP